MMSSRDEREKSHDRTSMRIVITKKGSNGMVRGESKRVKGRSLKESVKLGRTIIWIRNIEMMMMMMMMFIWGSSSSRIVGIGIGIGIVAPVGVIIMVGYIRRVFIEGSVMRWISWKWPSFCCFSSSLYCLHHFSLFQSIPSYCYFLHLYFHLHFFNSYKIYIPFIIVNNNNRIFSLHLSPYIHMYIYPHLVVWCMKVYIAYL